PVLLRRCVVAQVPDAGRAGVDPEREAGSLGVRGNLAREPDCPYLFHAPDADEGHPGRDVAVKIPAALDVGRHGSSYFGDERWFTTIRRWAGVDGSTYHASGADVTAGACVVAAVSGLSRIVRSLAST